MPRQNDLSLEERLWPKVNKHGPVPSCAPRLGPCWIWTGRVGSNGYAARIGANYRQYQVHRVTYELLVGPIPEGLELDHLCRVPLCVNPQHLEPVTHQENLRRGNTMTRKFDESTHCVNGHPRTPENLHVTKNGWRACKPCHAASHLRASRAYKERKRAERDNRN